jgi:hypothetical protein
MSDQRRRTGRIGRLDWTKGAGFRLLDENLDGSARFNQPSRRARLAVVVAILCGVLAGPATARAADPFGTAALVQQINSQVNAALAQTATAAPAAPAAPVDARQLVASVMRKTVSAAPTPAGSGSTGALALATNPPVVSASTTAPGVGSKTFDAATPGHSAAKPLLRARARARVQARTSPQKRLSARADADASGFSTVFGGSSYGATRVAVVSHARVTAKASARIRSSPNARPTRNASAGVEPQRHPPIPLPRGPGAAAPDLGSGQGSVMPLVVAAVLAAMIMFAFPLLPRTLPRPAFRKPRRIAFPPWRPG